MVSAHTMEVRKVLYREAGDPQAPAILLVLHGFATSSFMYRNLIPQLADRYHVIAPDLPGFGFTVVPGSIGGAHCWRPRRRRRSMPIYQGAG
jgi:pimeloyl-ACP methyl ester carboxylesterase